MQALPQEDELDLHFTEEELAFRAEVAEFVNRIQAIFAKMLLDQHIGRRDLAQWQRIPKHKGWAVPHWPVEWGSAGWSATQLYLYKDVLHRTPAMESHSVSINLIGGALVAFGSDEQKRRFLPKIANLDEMWCQGFPEPNAGSIALACNDGDPRGDEYVDQRTKRSGRPLRMKPTGCSRWYAPAATPGSNRAFPS